MNLSTPNPKSTKAGFSAAIMMAESQEIKETLSMSQHLRALLDAIPGVVVVINAKGLIVDFNVPATELLGDHLLDSYWRDVVNRTFLPNLDQGELRTASGQQFSISTRPLGYEPGQILLLSDVTQTRQLQRAAQQNLHLMTMGKMMASLAHQIRTPLSSSMLYLSQIMEGNLDTEKSQKFTQKTLDRIKHIETMINDMLVFAHGGQFHMSDFPVADLIKELIDQIQPQLNLHQATLKIDDVRRDILINGNKDALLGALANICMNALDAGTRYQDKNQQINIFVSITKKGQVLLSIKDNAGGMDENTLSHLFDPFFTTREEGTGLGLAVVKSVVESHQGIIEVDSTLGEGSQFDVYLPSLQASNTQLSHKEGANK